MGTPSPYAVGSTTMLASRRTAGMSPRYPHHSTTPSRDHATVLAPTDDSVSMLFVCLRNQTRILKRKSVLVSAPLSSKSGGSHPWVKTVRLP